MPRLREAKEQGKIAYLTYDKLVVRDRVERAYSPTTITLTNTRVRTFTMSSQDINPENINDFDLPYDATIGDGSLNTNSDSLNDTNGDVHFQQREYDHDGGQDGQSDVMFNIDPDNPFHASIPTDTKIITMMNSLSDMSNPLVTYHSYILMLEA